MSHIFKPGQKVICARPKEITNPDVIVIPKDTVVTILKPCTVYSGAYEIVEYPNNIYGEPASYMGHHFEPIVETTEQFVEVTFTKIIETAPKTCAS